MHDLDSLCSFALPTPRLLQHAQLLSDLVDALLAGHSEQAVDRLREANSPYARDWIEGHWGSGSFARARARQLPNQPPRGVSVAEHRTPRAISSTLQRQVVERDGFFCRMCGVPLVRDAVRKRIKDLLAPEEVWGNSNVTQNAALQCFWYQFDHALPYTRGGETELDNLVATCAGCNYGRMESTYAEVALVDPREVDRPLAPEGFEAWDGLERLLGARGWV